MSNLGVEVAHRLGYDDFNESLCDRKIVHSLLRMLKVKQVGQTGGVLGGWQSVVLHNGAWQAIQGIGRRILCLPESTSLSPAC